MAASTLPSTTDEKEKLCQRIKTGLNLVSVSDKLLCTFCSRVPVTHFLCQNDHPYCKTCHERLLIDEKCSMCPDNSILKIHEEYCVFRKSILSPKEYVETENDFGNEREQHCTIETSKITDQLKQLKTKIELVESDIREELRKLKEEFACQISTKVILETNFKLEISAKFENLIGLIKAVGNDQSTDRKFNCNSTLAMEQRISNLERSLQEQMENYKIENDADIRELKGEFSLIIRLQKAIDKKLEELCNISKNTTGQVEAAAAISEDVILKPKVPLWRQLSGLTQQRQNTPAPSNQCDNQPYLNQSDDQPSQDPETRLNFLADDSPNEARLHRSVENPRPPRHFDDVACSICRCNLNNIYQINYKYQCLTCCVKYLCEACTGQHNWRHYVLRIPPLPPFITPGLLKKVINLSGYTEYVWSGASFVCPQCRQADQNYRYDCLMCDEVHCRSCEDNHRHNWHYMLRMPNGITNDVPLKLSSVKEKIKASC